jgi:hypothetical protein
VTREKEKVLMEASDYNYAMTKPGGGMEAPLPKRQGARTMVPLSWLGREVSVDYSNGRGHDVSSVRGTLLDYCPLGLVLTLKGARTIIAFDRLVLVELVES